MFATTLFGLLIGTYLAITTANSYLSTGLFLFTGTGAERESLDPTKSSQTSQETIATGAAYILNTDELFLKVVERLGAARILQPYQPGTEGDSGLRAVFFRIQRDMNSTRPEDRTPDEALKRLKKTITIERPRYTDVLTATCLANDPRLAQEILKTYMDEAVKTHIKKYDSTRAYEESQKGFIDTQAKLTAAHLALREFLDRKAQVDDFDMEKKRLQLDATEGGVAAARLESEVAVKTEIVKDLLARLKGPDAIKEWTTDRVKPGLSSEALTKREGELLDLYEELAGLQRVTSDPNHQVIVDKQRQIAAKSSAIEQMRKISIDAKEVEVSVRNPAYADAQKQLTENQGLVTTLSTELKLTSAQQIKRTARLRQLLLIETEYELLRTTMQLAKSTEEAARVNWEAMQRKRLLGDGNFSSLRNVGFASLPLEKEGPNRGKSLLGGFFVGLFLGLGIIVLRSLPDSVVRTRDDLEQIESLAVIGVMPRLDGTNLRRHEALREQGW